VVEANKALVRHVGIMPDKDLHRVMAVQGHDIPALGPGRRYRGLFLCVTQDAFQFFRPPQSFWPTAFAECEYYA
jgi:hypothetical protein